LDWLVIPLFIAGIWILGWTADHPVLALAVGVGIAAVVVAWKLVRRRRRLSRLARRPRGPVATSRVPIPAGLRFAVLRRDGFRCAYCGQGEGDGVKLHIDHLVPVALGGKNEIDNLVTACQHCNLGKSAQDLIGV